MSWTEFGEILSGLIKRAEVLNKTLAIPFDTIVPVLRSGAFPGYATSIALAIRNIAPVYVIRGNCSFATDALSALAQAKHALICEVNVMSGKTVKNLSALFAKEYPKVMLSLLAVAWAHGTDEKVPGFENILIGRKTNERGIATQEEEKRLGLRTGATLFPWENLELELIDINS